MGALLVEAWLRGVSYVPSRSLSVAYGVVVRRTNTALYFCPKKGNLFHFDLPGTWYSSSYNTDPNSSATYSRPSLITIETSCSFLFPRAVGTGKSRRTRYITPLALLAGRSKAAAVNQTPRAVDY